MPENHEIDLCALSAYVLKVAGFPMSAYYKQLIEAPKIAHCFTGIEGNDSDGKVQMGYIDIHNKKKRSSLILRNDLR